MHGCVERKANAEDEPPSSHRAKWSTLTKLSTSQVLAVGVLRRSCGNAPTGVGDQLSMRGIKASGAGRRFVLGSP